MVERSEASEAHGARLKHVESFPRVPFPRSDFDRALLKLLRLKARDGRDGLCDGRRAAMVAVFNGRATYDAIRAWRRGAPVPQWAREMLARELETIGSEAQIFRVA